MDFVTHLPRTFEKNDVIWVVVDRLTKSTHFLPIRETTHVHELTEIFLRGIVRVHGVPVSIVSDRDTRLHHGFGRVSNMLGGVLQPGTKAYRLFDPVARKIHISRDVVFNEDKGWCWETTINVEAPGGDKYIFDFPETILHDVTNVPRDAYDDSVTTRKFRSLDYIYDHKTEVEMAEEELLLMGIDEPVCFEQAIKEPKWKDAMDKEIEAIEKNHTWRHGIDYEEVFAPVNLPLALAAKHNWEVHHLDVKSAFLNGVLQEEVYISQPKGYAKEGREHMVYRLMKALYGFYQAPRAWYARLNQYLLTLGFIKCPFENVVYIKRDGAGSQIVGVYVDDLIFTGANI
ncbi:uncharacterized protein LOC141711222 [Apium graveolens]|uniref:uncharacterized protein LOC141711222 n=1 Tax=Apium graveolens TaxID=4045 RepID=UPI003D7B9D9F